MLAPITRALVGVNEKHHGLILDIANKLGGENADAIHQSLATALREKPKPTEQEPTLTFFKKTALGSTSVTTYDLGKRLMIAQMLRALMKIADDAPLGVIEKLAKERKHPISSEQLKVILDKQAKFFLREEGDENFGLRGDGWANLILVQDAGGSVSVVSAVWDGYRWYRDRDSLDYGYVWGVDRRLVVSNSDTANL